MTTTTYNVPEARDQVQHRASLRLLADGDWNCC